MRDHIKSKKKKQWECSVAVCKQWKKQIAPLVCGKNVQRDVEAGWSVIKDWESRFGTRERNFLKKVQMHSKSTTKRNK